MKGLKILGIKEWAISHGLIITGLILFTIGTALGNVVLIILSAWVFVAGLCALFSAAFAKLSGK